MERRLKGRVGGEGEAEGRRGVGRMPTFSLCSMATRGNTTSRLSSATTAPAAPVAVVGLPAAAEAGARAGAAADAVSFPPAAAATAAAAAGPSLPFPAAAAPDACSCLSAAHSRMHTPRSDTAPSPTLWSPARPPSMPWSRTSRERVDGPAAAVDSSIALVTAKRGRGERGEGGSVYVYQLAALLAPLQSTPYTLTARPALPHQAPSRTYHAQLVHVIQHRRVARGGGGGGTLPPSPVGLPHRSHAQTY
jgi:hypothetical protein